MTILDDLGVTTLGNTLAKPRHYYLVKCEQCDSIQHKRMDQLSQTFCMKCTRHNQAIDKRKIAEHILLNNTQVCIHCGVPKDIECFGKRTAALTGIRSICKQCRTEQEADGNKQYRKSEKGKIVSANCQGQRRAQKLTTADNSIKTTALQQLKEQQNHKCYHCKTPLDYTTPKQVHLDHLIPISKGGKHTITNVVWSCAKCNLQKSNSL